MKQSPRSAGVHPRTGASMCRYHTLRSFVISLAIAIAITKSPASGFTIARDNLNSADLETEDSKQLEVKYDLKTLNQNETTYNNKTRQNSDSTVTSIISTNNINKQNYSAEKVIVNPLIDNVTADTQRKMSENDANKMSSDTTIIISTEISSYATSASSATETSSYGTSASSATETSSYATTAQSATQTESFQTERNQDLTTTSLPQSSLTTEIEYVTVTNEIEVRKIQESQTSSSEDQNYTEDMTFTGTSRTNNVNDNDANKIENKKNDFNNDVYTLITTTANSETKTTTETDFSDQTADQANAKELSTLVKADELLDASTTASFKPKKDVILEKDSTELTLDTSFTEDFTSDLYPATLPTWKKYTTIDRKRTSTGDVTTIDKDMTLAETAQSLMTLDKVFTNTPITSLEKLRNDFTDAQESTTKQLETTTGTETIVSNGTEFVTNTSTIVIGTEIDTEPTKLEIVSKRAGYKDNRETTTSKPEEATTTEFSPKESTNNTEMYGTMYETDVEAEKNKNGSVYESQSQLVEDAIKEELLREETLNDNEENAKLFTHSKQGRIGDGPSELVSDDSLSVKPIRQENKKNSILYAVNPNYKPLKKIDVQPPKQIVRDPDDNSWRNESISSLGIVFKPKNASKSFTQVLKNKTESELGNLTDRDSKEDLPDLRVRLEKIAEVRKSKKKINKFGDTVYSDYEESSENTNPSRDDTTTPMSPSKGSIFNLTPPPPSQSPTTEFDLTVNAISGEHFNLFNTEKTSPITTNKPSKFHNMAEYYDATDEYDADYVNQHKIDLKKFTQAMKTKETFATQPPELLRTQPIIEYQPERKATLQYFPPTQKVVQKVNINDYDTSFNRKVNMYTINNKPPKNVITNTFGTVAPTPRESYEPLNKVTMNSVYTPMYQNDNLDKNLYLSNQPRVSEPPHGRLVANDGHFNRASYVIKHYRDFINEAAKGGDDERSEEYTYTEPPIRGVTINELSRLPPRDGNQGEEEYEYDEKFRKDIMNRFVDNFNQNSERFKVDFPILYNSSVVHRLTPEHGRVASSSATMKRLYEINSRPSTPRRPCDPHCDKTVELSPAYELHYYVPDEEEKEEMEPRTITAPYRYRL